MRPISLKSIPKRIPLVRSMYNTPTWYQFLRQVDWFPINLQSSIDLPTILYTSTWFRRFLCLLCTIVASWGPNFSVQNSSRSKACRTHTVPKRVQVLTFSNVACGFRRTQPNNRYLVYHIRPILDQLNTSTAHVEGFPGKPSRPRQSGRRRNNGATVFYRRWNQSTREMGEAAVVRTVVRII